LIDDLLSISQNKSDDKIIALLDDKHCTPGEGIVCLAKEYDVSLIIIGSSGHGFIHRTILGSVSDYVVHHTHIPVTVVPHPKTEDGESQDD